MKKSKYILIFCLASYHAHTVAVSFYDQFERGYSNSFQAGQAHHTFTAKSVYKGAALALAIIGANLYYYYMIQRTLENGTRNEKTEALKNDLIELQKAPHYIPFTLVSRPVVHTYINEKFYHPWKRYLLKTGVMVALTIASIFIVSRSINALYATSNPYTERMESINCLTMSAPEFIASLTPRNSQSEEGISTTSPAWDILGIFKKKHDS